MLIKIIFYYLLGYVRIVIEGYYIERFINICTTKKIAIWHLRREKNVRLLLNVGIQDFKEVAQIAKKTKCRLSIQQKRGFPFLLHQYKKRKIFIGLLILICLLIGVSANFVWNVEIVAENGQTFEGISEDISEAGLTIGEWKPKVKPKDVINKIRLKRQDVAWMGIELKGTNAIVKLVKAEAKPEIVDEQEYCNIVSDKVGVVTKINVRNGAAAVKPGDTINVGSTLIHGWIEGKYTGLRYVHARGEVEAKVWYTKSKKIPYRLTERKDTGNTEKSYALKFNNFKINLPKRLSKFQIYDTIEEERKLKLFSNFYLPISIVETTNKEQTETTKNLTPEEAKTLGVEELEKKLNQEIPDQEKVVHKIINTYERGDSLEVFVTYEVLETIGTNEKIVF